jgi:hypothetical protein
MSVLALLSILLYNLRCWHVGMKTMQNLEHMLICLWFWQSRSRSGTFLHMIIIFKIICFLRLINSTLCKVTKQICAPNGPTNTTNGHATYTNKIVDEDVTYRAQPQCQTISSQQVSPRFLFYITERIHEI